MEPVTTRPDPTPRPASARAHAAIRAAALEIFRQEGLSRMTVESIAARAGASKATVYRRWPGKSAVLMEALLHELEGELAFPDTGSLHDDLVGQLSALARLLEGSEMGQLLVSLLGEAQHDDELAAAFRSGWLEPRRRAGREVLQRAVVRGELSAELDPELVLDLVYGPLYLRLLFGHAPLDARGVSAIVSLALQGISVE